MLVHVDLFSGIGGFALACDWNGIETIGFVEIDKYCQKVLRKHWPNVPIVEDIRDVEKIKEIVAKSYSARLQRATNGITQKDGTGQSTVFTRGCDKGRGNRDWIGDNPALLITGGFPCQPFSVAGKRGSYQDDRYLWPETIAVIEAINPKWVLLENVTGIINLALDTVLSDLEGAGYAYETLIIPACAVNAPHRRDRVWIVANSISRESGSESRWITSRAKDEGRRATEEGREIICPRTEVSLPSQSRQAGDIVAFSESREPRQQTQQEGGQNTGGGSEEDAADSQHTTTSRQRGYSREVYGIPESTGLDISSGKDWWAVEPELCVLADGLSQELDGGRLDARTINVSEDSTPFCWREVRRLWHDSLTRSASHGWRQDEQLAKELANILQRLSYPLALEQWQTTLETVFAYLYRMRQACEAIGALRNASVTVDEAWQSLSKEDKDWVVMATARGQWVTEWPNVGRVATGVKNRVDRLKCLGNAIVPQVAYEIIKAIKTNDRD